VPPLQQQKAESDLPFLWQRCWEQNDLQMTSAAYLQSQQDA